MQGFKSGNHSNSMWFIISSLSNFSSHVSDVVFVIYLPCKKKCYPPMEGGGCQPFVYLFYIFSSSVKVCIFMSFCIFLQCQGISFIICSMFFLHSQGIHVFFLSSSKIPSQGTYVSSSVLFSNVKGYIQVFCSLLYAAHPQGMGVALPKVETLRESVLCGQYIPLR